MSKFHIYRDMAGEYRWRLVARNGEKVAASEGYTSKENAIKSAERVKIWANSAEIVDDTLIKLALNRLLNRL